MTKMVIGDAGAAALGDFGATIQVNVECVHGLDVDRTSSRMRDPAHVSTANLRKLKENHMFFSSFLILFMALFVAWVLGGFVFHVAGGLIHILLVVAVISLIVHFVRGRP